MNIFTHLNKTGEALYRRLREEHRLKLLEAFKRGGPLSEREVTMLLASPEIAYDLAPALLRSEDALEQLLRFPQVLFYALIGDYETAGARLEPYVVGEGEGENVFRLLCWAKRAGTTLRRPLPYYESWLARDPYWAGVYLTRNPSDRLAAEVSIFAQQAYKEDAGAAYAYLRTHPEVEPSSLTKVINSNPFYLFLSILAYPGVFNTMLVLRSSLSPRWAYHLALTTGCTDKSLMEDVMLTDLGWLLEYYVDSGMAADRSNARHISARYCSSAESHPHCCGHAAASFINRLASHFQSQAKAC